MLGEDEFKELVEGFLSALELPLSPEASRLAASALMQEGVLWLSRDQAPARAEGLLALVRKLAALPGENLGAFLTSTYEHAALAGFDFRGNYPARHLVLPGSFAWLNLVNLGRGLELEAQEKTRLALAAAVSWDTLIEGAANLLRTKKGFEIEAKPVDEPVTSILLDPDLLWAGGEMELLPELVRSLTETYRKSTLVLAGGQVLTYIGFVIPTQREEGLEFNRAYPAFISFNRAVRPGTYTAVIRGLEKERPSRWQVLAGEDGYFLAVPLEIHIHEELRKAGLTPITLASKGTEARPGAVLARAFGEIRVGWPEEEVTDLGELYHRLAAIEGIRHGYCGSPIVTFDGQLWDIVSTHWVTRGWHLLVPKEPRIHQLVENFRRLFGPRFLLEVTTGRGP